MGKKFICSIDIMDIKQKLESGKFAVKINMFGSVLLEDTQTCEAIQLMQLPEGYSFHHKGKWRSTSIYMNSAVEHCTECNDGWECSECGYTTAERSDWCPDCGADMRDSNRASIISKNFKELVAKL
jgi:hypothetical protein